MSRSKGKHRRERKRRHKRQIEEGKRTPTPKVKHKKTTHKTNMYKRIKLSEIDRDVVRAVIDIVKNINVL